MSANKVLADAIRARLAEIDEERNHLVALLQYYGAPPPKANLGAAAKSADTQGALFETRPSGPTDRLLTVVAQTPGMKYGEVIDRAEVGMETNAEKPRRSLGSTLGSLVKRGRIRKSDDGGYYPIEEPQ